MTIRKHELLGRQFGYLLVKCEVQKKGGNKSPRWYCTCICGGSTTTTTNQLVTGGTVSCGCFQKEKAATQFKEHGLSGKPLYNRWRWMMQRCYNQNNRSYVHYGARGIRVCTRWHNPVTFYEDNIDSFQKELELERIDNERGYSPENCKWVTRKDQCNNTRRNRQFTFGDETQNLAQWANKLSVKDRTLRSRIRLGWNIEDVLLTPVAKRKI
jgi:hypothetical protein